MHIIDEEEGIDAIFYLMGRRFSLNRGSGTQTELRLKEDGIWTPDAYAQKAEQARKRKGRKKSVTDKRKSRRGSQSSSNKLNGVSVFE